MSKFRSIISKFRLIMSKFRQTENKFSSKLRVKPIYFDLNLEENQLV